jgi:hypothetical protein
MRTRFGQRRRVPALLGGAIVVSACVGGTCSKSTSETRAAAKLTTAPRLSSASSGSLRDGDPDDVTELAMPVAAGVVRTLAGQYRYFAFDSTEIGNCVVRNTEYRIYHDGSVSWSAEIMARRAQERAAVTLIVFDDRRTFDVNSGSWRYDVRDAGEWKRWNARVGPNPTIAARWAEATRVRRKIRC